MKTKIFIDGSEGTTGLRLGERLQNREDIELLLIDPDLRKDSQERKKILNQSDIAFLCLPDQAAKEAVAMVENENVRIVDTSTAHRTNTGWAYGLPELSRDHKEKIKTGRRIAVPGCYATGFIALVYPLLKTGVMPEEYPVSCMALSGYSGGGKKLIAEYEDENRSPEYSAPREYGLGQQHKHLKEMKAVTGIARKPLFTPVVSDYYCGMVVSVPIYSYLLNDIFTPEGIHAIYASYYAEQKFIKVLPFGTEEKSNGFLSGSSRAGWDDMEIYITGNEERILLTAHFDNLGKGASGAAIQCLNIMMGCEEESGLITSR